MNRADTSGPAFPVTSDNYANAESTGMKLRDYFAAKAMQAEMMNGVHESDFPEYAGRAYKMADAMLKARKA